MPSNTSNNKTIAKNSFLLYIRMFFTMVISLYTSRVVLSALGVGDYGIYNVVGGIITFFTFVSGSLNAAISRFLTFELGKKNIEKLQRTFSSSVIIMLIYSLIVVAISETVVLWFLNYKLNIPEGRMVAANWVFQFSVITFCVSLISIPYNAAIIAHEKMSAFAYISILEALGKLLIAFLIVQDSFDRLIYYALLTCILSVLIRIIYDVYCKRYFAETKGKLILDKILAKEMFGFTGWNLIGAGSFVLMNQGIDVLVNLFFGVAYNAARGIAATVSSAANQMVNNFTTAIKPQIIKSYASGNISYMTNLVITGSKFSFFLFLFICIPFLFESQYILSLWLVDVPENAAIFTKLSIIVIMISTLSDTIITSIMATGKVKTYQICVGGLGMLIFPIVYVLFVLGLPAYFAYLIHILIFIIQLVYRLYYMNTYLGVDYKKYVFNVITRIIPVFLLASLIPLLMCILFEDSIFRLLMVIIVSTICLIISIYFVGLNKSEKDIVTEKAISVVLRIKRKNESLLSG